jgi:hypothetical protein
MTRRFYLAAALAAVLGAGPAVAQYDLPASRPPAPRTAGDPKPAYKYELKPEHSEYVVFVKAYQAPAAHDARGQARELAEGLAEWIRSECRLYAYVHERGWLLRREQDREKEATIKAIRDYYVPRGESEEQIAIRIKREVKFARIPDEYAVFVVPGKGTLKSLDEAAEFARYLHKLPCPPDQFCDSVFVGAERGTANRSSEKANPFERAMPGRNPTLPKKEVAAEIPKAELELLDRLNRGQPYSLIHHTKKPVTLVVQSYGSKQGAGQLVKPGEVIQTTGRAEGEMLERAAQQANSLVEVLRKQPAKVGGPFDAYVLHTRYESFVCVGEYDSKDDDKLLAVKKMLAGWQLKDQKTGLVLETLMEKPIPAAIPRP